MEDLFDPTSAEELRSRIHAVSAASERQWGKMCAAQMLEHCARGKETATGDLRPPRVLISWVLGPVIKPFALKDGEPMRRNSPTAPMLVVSDGVDLETSRARLLECFDRFSSSGPDGCTAHPHAFFGPLRPAEWSKLMHKHLDHHLRQFNT
jgi:hypothetical protein